MLQFSICVIGEIFPDLPPKTYIPTWDVSRLGMPDKDAAPGPGGPNYQGFGFVVIDGPKGSVAKLSKRSGSHYELLECPRHDGRSMLRIVCTIDSQRSNCNDIYLDGVNGTIIEMPEDCDSSKYAIAHDLRISSNQSVPETQAHLTQIQVLDLEMSYDFSQVERVKEAAGDVYIRIDYSNLPGYWNSLVNSDGEKRKRSVLDKRFFSPHPGSWGSRFDGSSHPATTRFSGVPKQPLYGGTKSCSDHNDAFADINLEGTIAADTFWGFSMVGTIAPFNIKQAYDFLDASLELEAKLQS
jgi:hypothetical protein